MKIRAGLLGKSRREVLGEEGGEGASITTRGGELIFIVAAPIIGMFVDSLFDLSFTNVSSCISVIPFGLG